MEKEQVGCLYLPESAEITPEMIYRYSQRGHRLLLVEENVSDARAKDVQNGVLELGFYEDGPVLFLLFRFGEGEWNETPFSWHLTPRNQRAYPGEASDNELKIILVNAPDGVIRAVRSIPLDSEFGRQFQAAIGQQAAGSFNGQSYAKHLNSVWNQLSVEDMVRNAVSFWQSE